MRNANEGVSLTEAILAIRGIDKYASYKTIKTIKTIIITIVLIILALAFFSLVSSLVSAAGRVAVAIQAVCYLCLCMAIIIMVVIKISSFIDERREKLELKRAELDKIKIKARQKIYKRLRYVENDHIVFDPVTGRKVPAKWACIHKVIDEIIADKSNNVIMFDPVTGREFLADGCNNVKKVAAPLKDTMKCTEENIT
ncbi:hypothetical protein NKL90_004533 [Salmonella enterica]|nr:hypothetical protein [Salmonella enterica subsp. enterica serovar Reading]EDX9957706.1 hypothetical protein [Salmonella enterica]EFS9003060.1 hypothetical protein [Salmonella enterica]EGL2682872.1 hypothetical protein [Salmonella enterica]EHO6032128.1 hypothetical protein [Salmonella enterica]